MNYYFISGILNSFTSLTISSFILFQNPLSQKNRSFFYFGLFVALWAGFYSVWTTATIKESALFFMRISIGLAIFIPTTFFHFSINLINDYKKYKKIIYLLYLFSTIILITTPSNLFIYDIKQISNFNYWPVPGITYHFYTISYVLFPFYGLYLIHKKSKMESEPRKNQLNFVFWGVLLAHIGGFSNFPLSYSINIPPVGNIFVSLYTLFIAYASFKYQLMEVEIIFRKSLIYSLLIIIIAIFYFLSIYFTEHALEKTLGYRSVFISLFFAIVIASLFMPIKNFIEKFLFEKDLGLIAEENELLRKEIIQVEKLKCISIFASGMAHEIKNPLTVIKTFSEYLPKKIHDREFLNKFCQIINQEVTRIDNLVHDLLEFSKPSPPVLRKLDVHALLNTTLELLNNEFIKHHIKVQKNFIAPHDLHLSLDSNQIKQSFLNIFLNAVEAMPNGGQLDIKTAIKGVNNKLIIKIQDSGLGIPAKDLPYIFDPFFTNKDHGTGLGLSITHEIIKNHQGKIYVESIEGKGATFILELPL